MAQVPDAERVDQIFGVGRMWAGPIRRAADSLMSPKIVAIHFQDRLRTRLRLR
jgi:hypothetical protein